MIQLTRTIAAIMASAAILAACATTPADEARPEVSHLVFIGDSNLDIGRMRTEQAGDTNDGKLVPPNTVGDRYADSTVLPEFLSQRLGLSQTNYAWGGATTGMTNIVGAREPNDATNTGTLAQMQEFEAALNGQSADPDALYMLMAGSNDLAFVDKTDQPAIEAAIAGALTNLRATITKLDDLGAEFIVVGTRTPRPVLSDHDIATAEPDEEAKNDAAGRQLNIAIRQLVADLDAELEADVEVFDFYANIRDIAENAESFGLAPYSADPARYCTAEGVSDCTRLINYDAAHKTTAVHAILADRFIEQFDLED